MHAILNPILHATCLKSRYSLRFQLVVGYGCVAIFMILLAVVFATIAAVICKSIVEDTTQLYLREERITRLMTENSILLAGLIQKRIETSWRGSAALLSELITDRLYYHHGIYDNGIDDDDLNNGMGDAGSNGGRSNDQYPLKAPIPMPEFITESNWIESGLADELTSLFMENAILDRKRRQQVFEPFRNKWSTAHAMCWNCNRYYSSNSTTLGTATDATRNHHAQIVADIGMLLKPLWEAEPAAFQLRVGFFFEYSIESSQQRNSGGGTTIFFPSFKMNNEEDLMDDTDNNNNLFYTSSGCNWMVQEINPYTQQPYGTQLDAEENCAPAGTQVPIEEYNMKELDFCHDQILHPGETRIYGPHVDPITNQWVMTVGQAIYDVHGDGDLIACTALDLSAHLVLDGILNQQYGAGRLQQQNNDNTNNEKMNNNTQTSTKETEQNDDDFRSSEGRIHAAIVRPDGTVLEISSLSGEDENFSLYFDGLHHITETGFMDSTVWENIISSQWNDVLGIDDENDTYNNNNNIQKKWNSDEIQERLFHTYTDTEGRTFSAVPSPLPPVGTTTKSTNLSEAFYRPEFFIIESAQGEEIFSVLDDISGSIHDDTRDLIATSVGLGLAGLAVFMAIVWLVSKILTRPLKYMESVSWKIVNHSNTNKRTTRTSSWSFQNSLYNRSFGGRKSFISGVISTIDAFQNGRAENDDDGSGSILLVDVYKQTKSPLLPCTPQTEITNLVSEFQAMVRGFSGTGSSQVALPTPEEILNCVTWKEPFGRLYDLNAGMKEALEQERKNSSIPFKENDKEKENNHDNDYDQTLQRGDQNESGVANGSDKVSGSRRQSMLRSSIVSLFPMESSILEDYEDVAATNDGPDTNINYSSRSIGRGGMQSAWSRRQSLLRSSMVSLSPMDLLGDLEEEKKKKLESEQSAMFRSAQMVDAASASAYFGGRIGSSAMFRVGSVTRTNLGPNSYLDGAKDLDAVDDKTVIISRSALFRWILGCIAFPLLVTITIICAVVAQKLLNSFPTLAKKGADLSFQLGMESMRNTAVLRALQTEQVQQGSLRDLFILTRGAGWLLFDAMNRSDVFADTEIRMVEECKTYPLDEQCPSQNDDTRSPCDCEWNDPWKRECKSFPSGSRQFQRPFYMNQARDFDPITGYRNESISFPEFDYSPETTLWWTNTSDMPGAYKGAAVSGYGTTYDRLRVTAALSAITLPLYNYVLRDRYLITHTSMSSYVAYESDGTYWGYSGCADDSARYANFESTEGNAASVVRPELCPLGKFGYDPRCRSWYANTKKNALDFGEGIHVTAPYIFATVEDVGVSAGSPLIDPTTGEYVGTAVIDIPLEGALPVDMPQTDSDFTFVISPDAFFATDTILGPDFPVGSPPMQISDLVLPNDEIGSENRMVFDDITQRMKLGESGGAEFYRSSPQDVEDTLKISFAPVYARILTPVQPNDYSRGVDVSQVLLYSIGVVRSVGSLSSPFQEVEDDITDQVESIVVIYLSSVAVVTFFCILFAAKISVAITKPMMILLRIVQLVNAGRNEGDLPPMTGGSREVNQVYASFAKLYKIIRMSNASFFSGNFKWAHHIATDALKLFQKIGDDKAIAVACNNAGNTKFALSMQSRAKGSCEFVDGICCVKSAIENFNEAIEIGQREFDEGENDAIKADFAQQLADRHFNRALCLLHSLDDPCTPENAREMAYADLVRCRDYDRGVRDYFMHAKLMFKNCDVCFERNLRRLHGLASLFPIDKSVWQIWDVNELIDQADLMLQAAWNREEAPLFRTLTRVGRLQQLEGAVIDLEMSSGKVEEAARLSMRMLIEDEYILETSFAFAADCVLQVMRESSEESPWPKAAITGTRYEFQRMRKLGKRTTLNIGRSFVFCIELAGPVMNGSARSLLNQECLAFYDEQCDDNDTVGLVGLSNNVDSNLIVKLGPKESDVVAQRDGIMKAIREPTKSTSYPALPTAVNMIIDSARSNAQDVILIYISDGAIWDPHSFSVMEAKIKEASEKKTSTIDIITIGIGVNEDEEFARHCKNLCIAARSRHSRFYSPTVDDLEETFETAGALISATSSARNSRILLGTTMQKF